MANTGETDWVGTAVGGILLLSLAIIGGYFAIDQFQAAFLPKQHAAAEARRQTVIEAATAEERTRAAQEEAARTKKQEAERQEAQAYASAREAVEAVRSSLTDSDSAIFKDVWAVRGKLAETPEGVFACGSVNAKNSFGGYVGYMPFVAIGSTVVTPQDGIFEGVFREVCLGGKKLFPVQV